jgi:hypothetical protein
MDIRVPVAIRLAGTREEEGGPFWRARPIRPRPTWLRPLARYLNRCEPAPEYRLEGRANGHPGRRQHPPHCPGHDRA